MAQSAITIYILLTIFISTSSNLRTMESLLPIQPKSQNSKSYSITYLDIYDNSPKKCIPKFPKRTSISLTKKEETGPLITLTPSSPQLKLLSQKNNKEDQDSTTNTYQIVIHRPGVPIKNLDKSLHRLEDKIANLIMEANSIQDHDQKIKKVKEVILEIKDMKKEFNDDNNSVDIKEWLEQQIDNLKNRNNIKDDYENPYL